MTQTLYPPTNPQSIAQVLDGAFRIFQVSLPKCVPHGVAAMVAGQVPNIYYLAKGKAMHSFGGGDPLWWALYFAGTLTALVLWSAMMLRQRNIVTRQPTDAGAEVGEAVQRVPALIGVMLLLMLAVSAGLIALIVPGLYLTIALSLSWPALLLERRNPPSAMRYSLELVKGHWWRTAAVFTVAMIIALVFYIVVFATLGIALSLAGANDVAMFTAASVVVLIALGAVGVPFYGAVLLALYGDLKLRRQGAALATGPAGAASA